MLKQTITIALMMALSMSYSLSISAQKGNDKIKLNQVGYYPEQEKIIVVEGNERSITVKDEYGTKVLEADRIAQTVSPISKKQRSTFDVSGIIAPGKYQVYAGKQHVQMNIDANALDALGAAAIKSFYFMRSGVALKKEYAGQWARPAAHMDTKVIIHPAAASAARPAGTVIGSPRGWYDAGDYNKYVVNSAFAMGLMLSMYEMVPAHFQKQNAGLPESNNATPDLLDENMWNLQWLFTMQDFDGGVYHKLTTPSFEGFVMPSECKQPRYMTQKSTCATLDFAAIMAKCARVYATNTEYHGVSVSALNAARLAYEWAKKNPTMYYEQDQLNAQYEPKVTTGTYGDRNANDEFFWAAVELYLTTHEKQYLEDACKYAPSEFATPSWAGVSSLGAFALVMAKKLPAEAQQLMAQQKQTIIDYAEKVCECDLAGTAFYAPYGNKPTDFFWGCNSEGCGVQGVSLLFAYKLTNDKKYLENAFRDADYMLGRNATGYCYVTGFGEKSPMHPHHRISESDGIVEPVPGLLVGGPNPGQQDKDYCHYYSNFADESYVDVMASYASNEIAINWSATLVALINGLIAVK